MAEPMNTERERTEQPELATLIIPAQLAEQVVEFIGTLRISDDDVDGYMIGSPSGDRLAFNSRNAVAIYPSTSRACWQTMYGMDFQCLPDFG